jgi:PAS domain S-box-containing protein
VQAEHPSQNTVPASQDRDSLAALQAELKTLRQQLDQERRLRKTLFDSLRVAVYVVDPDGLTIIDCNQVFLEQFQVSRQEAIGRTCYEVTRRRLSPCFRSHEDCPLLATAETGRPSTNEFEFQTAQGENVVLECTTTPVLDRHGNVTMVVHVVRDITYRRRIEDKLREANRELRRSNAFLRNLINSSVDAVIAADLSGRILLFNHAAEEITGYRQEEVVGRMDIRDIYPDDGAREVMRMLRSEKYGGRGKLRSQEVMLRHKDGSLIPISLSAAIVYDGGREVSTVGFFHDLREKKAMEAELDRARLQLLQAEKMASIGKLAAGVAHQLNNPLAGITLFAHALKEDYDLSPEALADLDRILDNAQRCRDTVKELLQFARQTTQEMRPTDLNQALERTLFLLENQALFQNIEIRRDLDSDLPLVPADVQQLNHVFMNIVLNAAEAMEGKGTLTVSTRWDQSRKRVVVEIADSGPGIPPQVLSHIFEPFYTTKEEGKGTGLGLSVAYGVIENHGGSISARNRPEGGAVFRIELPADQQARGSR